MPARLTDMIRRHSSNVISSQAVNGTMAATFASTSTLPCRERVSSTARWTSSGLETSACTAVPSIPAAVRSAPSPFRSTATIFAPSAASLSATAFPIPCAAPVTIATRSCSFISCLLALVELRRVLVAVPGVHVVREEDLGFVLRGDLLHARDRRHSGNRVVMEPGLHASLERLGREDHVEREHHRLSRVGRHEQRVVPDRMAPRLEQPEAACELGVARDRPETCAFVVP